MSHRGKRLETILCHFRSTCFSILCKLLSVCLARMVLGRRSRQRVATKLACLQFSRRDNSVAVSSRSFSLRVWFLLLCFFTFLNHDFSMTSETPMSSSFLHSDLILAAGVSANTNASNVKGPNARKELAVRAVKDRRHSLANVLRWVLFCPILRRSILFHIPRIFGFIFSPCQTSLMPLWEGLMAVYCFVEAR